MLRLAVSLLLAVPVLSQFDKSVKNEQTSPDKQCNPTGACIGFTKLSPTHNLHEKSATQYHTAGNPDFFATVNKVSVGTLTVGDPWNVGRFTLETKKTIVMPKTFPFGNNKGIELRTIRLVTGEEKTHRWGPLSFAKYDLEVVLVGRNLDQPDEFEEDSYVAFSRAFDQKDTDIDPADGEFLVMMDDNRGTSFEVDLKKVFPKDQSITTYSGSNAEACSCTSDTTWVLFSAPSYPDYHVSKGLMDRIKGLGLSENAWRKYDEGGTKDVVVVAHQFGKKCDKKWDEDCGDTCDCGGADDGAGNKGDSDDDCKKQPTPAHCMSSAGTVEVCLAFTFLAAVPFF